MALVVEPNFQNFSGVQSLPAGHDFDFRTSLKTVLVVSGLALVAWYVCKRYCSTVDSRLDENDAENPETEPVLVVFNPGPYTPDAADGNQRGFSAARASAKGASDAGAFVRRLSERL